MKTEELLAYEAMYAAMREALGTSWLVFQPRPTAAGPEPGRQTPAQSADSSRDFSGSRK